VTGLFRAAARPSGVALALLAGLVACSTADRSGGPARPLAQVIADPALSACVAAAAGFPDAAGNASDAALGAIRELHCDGQTSAVGPIRSLDGLQRLTALSVLDAPRNAIADLTPLAALHELGTLTLTANQVSDLTPLTGLPDLDTLRLAHNRVVDPAPLGTIPTLLRLDVFDNQIVDVAGLAPAPLLQELQLGANPLTDLAPLVAVRSLVNLGLDESAPARIGGIDELRAAGVHVNGLA